MLLELVLYAVVYSVVGIAVLWAGFVALDLLTPGKLATEIWEGRSTNAAVVSAAGTLGLGAIVFTAIWTNGESAFGSALLWTAVFGVVGVALQAVSFVLLDLVTPGRLGDVVCERAGFHPASLVVAASKLSVSAIVVAAIA